MTSAPTVPQESPLLEVECTAAELLYVGELLGGAVLLGLPDPLADVTPEQVDAILGEAQERLIARGLLDPQPALPNAEPDAELEDGVEDGVVALDTTLASLASTVFFPAVTVILRRGRSQEAQPVRAFYLWRGWTVEVMPVAADGRYRLTGLTGVGQLVERLVGALELPSARHTAAQPVVLSAGEPVRAFVESLGSERQEYEVVVFRSDDTYLANGQIASSSTLGIVAAGEQLWRLHTAERDGAAQVEAHPTAPGALRDDLRRWLALLDDRESSAPSVGAE